MSDIRAEVRIKGRVQGVNFRNFVQHTAREKNVVGWVKNLPDGDVQGVFEGAQGAVEELVKDCRRGPPAGRVSDLEVSWEEARGEFDRFEVRY